MTPDVSAAFDEDGYIVVKGAIAALTDWPAVCPPLRAAPWSCLTPPFDLPSSQGLLTPAEVEKTLAVLENTDAIRSVESAPLFHLRSLRLFLH